MTETLFDIPEPPRLRPPKTAPKAAVGEVVYAPYKTVNGRCEDCALVVYEALQAGSLSAPPIRSARFKRTQGALVTLLCSEHKNIREISETRRAA